MNNELMQNEDFIRCSTMIAELLMKYKAMEDKDAEESGMQETASCLYCMIVLILFGVVLFQMFVIGAYSINGPLHISFLYGKTYVLVRESY